MTNASATIAGDLSRYYQERADTIVDLVQPLSLHQIWTRPYPYGNSIGHLLLHLTGNLNYYVGAEIAGTGYLRNRPLEFSDPVRHPREEILKNFTDAIALVRATLARQSEADWSAPYTAKGMEQAGDRFYMFLTCAAHLSHHTGQIIYLCKAFTGS
ncbi:MAG TPA: DinB family protein [Candidatus Angelobacter sp.]|nr:DinB family protein [Candidatus Angelobacter sp.]